MKRTTLVTESTLARAAVAFETGQHLVQVDPTPLHRHAALVLRVLHLEADLQVGLARAQARSGQRARGRVGGRQELVAIHAVLLLERVALAQPQPHARLADAVLAARGARARVVATHVVPLHVHAERLLEGAHRAHLQPVLDHVQRLDGRRVAQEEVGDLGVARAVHVHHVGGRDVLRGHAAGRGLQGQRLLEGGQRLRGRAEGVGLDVDFLVVRRGRLLQRGGVGQNPLQQLLRQRLARAAPGAPAGAVAAAAAGTAAAAAAAAGGCGSGGGGGGAGGEVVERAAGEMEGGEEGGAAVVDDGVEAAVGQLGLGAGRHVGAHLVPLQVHLQHSPHHVAHPAPPSRRRAPEACRNVSRRGAVHVAGQRDEEVGRDGAELAVAVVVVVLA